MIDVNGPSKSAEDVKAFFDANPSIEFLRLQWLDFSATVRARIVTVRQALRLAGEGRTLSVASPLTSALLIDGSFHEVNPGAHDNLVPDWSTLTPCHYQSGHAAVMCCVEQEGSGFDCCPRSVLRKIEQQLKEQHDMTFLVGVEIEFYLTTSAETTTPVKDVTSYCSTASLRRPYLAVLEDSVRAIEKANIPTWTTHSELVAGLFEISTDPLSPLKAADALVYIHEAIKASAVKHGFHATMHPKPFDKSHGVGQHMHISLSSQSDKDDSFLAGVLDSVPALSAISMPNFDSWLRREFAGGEWIGWDVENRMSCVRKIRRAYWEFRFIDCTANAYLTLATLLGVGMAAWEKGKPLTAKPMSQWSPTLDEKGRQDSGIEKSAPRDLKDAIQAFKEDEAVKEVLGNELWERFTRYKEHEEQMMAGLTLPERRKLCMEIF